MHWPYFRTDKTLGSEILYAAFSTQNKSNEIIKSGKKSQKYAKNKQTMLTLSRKRQNINTVPK